MRGLSDLFPITDSSLCQSLENGWLLSSQKIGFSGTKQIEQSLTIGWDIKSSFTAFYLEPQEEGGFVAFSKDFPRAVGQGETIEEALADLEGAIQLLREVLEEDKASQRKR